MRLTCILPLLLLVACAADRLPAPRTDYPVLAVPAARDDGREAVVVREAAPVVQRRIVITTGVHGNEPSGWLVQDELATRGFTVFGPCNPWGIKNNSRFLEDGRDLNRIFAVKDSTEVDAVKAFLEANQPDFLLDLHEDPDGTGCYLIQHGPDDDIGRRIIDALKDEFEFDPAPRFMMVEGEDGLLKPTLQHLRGMAFVRIYGLAYYAWATYGCTSIVVECPGSWPEERRKAYQLRVCEVAQELFDD
jgi:hypothetical protein